MRFDRALHSLARGVEPVVEGPVLQPFGSRAVAREQRRVHRMARLAEGGEHGPHLGGGARKAVKRDDARGPAGDEELHGAAPEHALRGDRAAAGLDHRSPR